MQKPWGVEVWSICMDVGFFGYATSEGITGITFCSASDLAHFTLGHRLHIHCTAPRVTQIWAKTDTEPAGNSACKVPDHCSY